MRHKNRVNKQYIEEEAEPNYNVCRPRANDEEDMRQTMKLFKEELIELIKTYLNPWLKE